MNEAFHPLGENKPQGLRISEFGAEPESWRRWGVLLKTPGPHNHLGSIKKGKPWEARDFWVIILNHPDLPGQMPVFFNMEPTYGGFVENGGTPIAGWLISWKSYKKMDDLGVPLF